MHPILQSRPRLGLYLVAWTIIGVFVAIMLVEVGTSFGGTLMLAIPPTLVYSFICLAAWYPVRSMPLRRATTPRILLAHVIAAVFMSGAWLAVFQGWSAILDTTARIESATAVIVTGALLYMLSVAFHYLVSASEEAHQVEKRESEVRILAREAELKALKAQLDPHFLFNALNSISSLCGSNPASARTLTTLLAEYLRKSLRVGASDAITLSDEIELVSSYLAIERIRFGPRLEFEQNVDENVRDYRVPPLLLQPLVENAVTHGIAHLIEGGVVRLAARRNRGTVEITVENPCDAERPSSRGHGIGLENTRRRMTTYYGDSARVHASDGGSSFRVTLELPS